MKLNKKQLQERKESLNKIRRAYARLELGFQRGASRCTYYDEKTDSKCAVGVLFDRNELVSHERCLNDNVGDDIAAQLGNTKVFKGLYADELINLQDLHDVLIKDYITHRGLLTECWINDVNEFEKYLFSLKENPNE